MLVNVTNNIDVNFATALGIKRGRFDHVSQVDVVGLDHKMKVAYKREELEMAPRE